MYQYSFFARVDYAPCLKSDHRDSTEPLDLPKYADDYTEFFYGAMIERKADSLDLTMTMFLVCHQMTVQKHHVEGLENSQIDKWKKMMMLNKSPRYYSSGIRRNAKYFCRMRNSEDSSAVSYITAAHFMPNRLTGDANANGNVDILRCPISDSAAAYVSLAETEHNILVEVIRGPDKNRIISFSVPWKSRQSGYMMSSSPLASTLDPWVGRKELLLANKLDTSGVSKSAKPQSKQKEGEMGRHSFYMCVGGMESPFDRRLLPLYAEFLEHHIQLGVQHIFIAATYMWGGVNMNNMLSAFSSYIMEGLLSVTSSTVGMGASELLYAVNGISLARDTVKVIFSNMCLYYAKGTADYVGVWVRLQV